MTRRALLALLAGAALDPERLLWRPGARLISIPKPIFLRSVCSCLAADEMFTIEGVYNLNPQTKEIAIFTDQNTGRRFRLRRVFVVTSGNTIFPPIITDGPYKNADHYPTMNAIVTRRGPRDRLVEEL